jgi:Integrase core domain/Integrase zinc binding domain
LVDAHEVLGHVGYRKLAEAVLSHHWWPGLWKQAALVTQARPMCQVERVGRETWGPVRTLDAPTRPLLGWSVDLMGPMPPDERGNRYLAVAVDVFSKWVEARAIPDKCAFTTCEWLYDDIIARWGRPLYIRLDRGGEWEAEFGAALRRLHILPRRGSSGNSRYNGLSERYI